MGVIQLTINGEPHAATAGTTLEELLAALRVPPERVVVDRNGQVVERCRRSAVVLQEADRLEIVRFVAGG